MRLRFLPPRPPGWVARVGSMDGLRLAILPRGTVVAAAPTPAALAASVARLGGRLERGAAPDPRTMAAHGSAFAHRVWRACRRIRPGKTLTYGRLARRLGVGSARAVGQALKSNPLAMHIPCHRVVASRGIGGFAWGAGRKAAWLGEERG